MVQNLAHITAGIKFVTVGRESGEAKTIFDKRRSKIESGILDGIMTTARESINVGNMGSVKG